MALFFKITNQTYKLKFPSGIDSSAKSLIKHLLTHEINKRYGCGLKGISQIKNHRFFKSIDWDLIKERKWQTVPFIPKISNQLDSSYYMRYSEETSLIQEGESVPISAERDPFLSW